MDKRYKYLIKNTGILTISNFASKILVFLLVPLYTSILSTEEYGIYDLIVSTVSLVYPILTLNIVDAVMRYSMDREVNKNNAAWIGFRYIIVSISVMAIGLTLCRYISNFEIIHGLENFIFAYYVSYIIYQYFVQLSKGLEKVSTMAVAAILCTVVMLAGNILFLLVFKWTLKGFLLANILSLALPDIYFIVKLDYINFIKTARFDCNLKKEMLRYSIPLIFSTLGWWINSASDRYVVTFICGLGANGILAVAYKIPGIINTVFGMFGQAWQISVIKEYGEKNSKKFYSDSFIIINFMMCTGCAVLMLLSKPLAEILYAKEFYNAWQYAPFLLVSTVFNTLSGLIGPILSAAKNSGAMAKSAFYGASINIILNIVLVYLAGIQGAAVATSIAAFVIYLVRKKAVKNELIIDKYYKIIIMWIFLIVQAILEVYTTLWYVEILIISIYIVMNLNTLKNLQIY